MSPGNFSLTGRQVSEYGENANIITADSRRLKTWNFLFHHTSKIFSVEEWSTREGSAGVITCRNSSADFFCEARL
jgi:hypothetical protein